MRRRPATRRRRLGSAPARTHSRGCRTRGSARIRPRRTGADSRPPLRAPPFRRGRSSSVRGPSRAAASAPARGADTLGWARRPTTQNPRMPRPRPRPSDRGMITNRANLTPAAAPLTRGGQGPECAKGGSHFGSTRPILDVESALDAEPRPPAPGYPSRCLTVVCSLPGGHHHRLAAPAVAQPARKPRSALNHVARQQQPGAAERDLPAE